MKAFVMMLVVGVVGCDVLLLQGVCSNQSKNLKPLKVSQSYTGKYQKEKSIQEILSELPALCSEAFSKACTSLGIKPDDVDPTKFTVRVEDTQTGKEAKFGQFTGTPFKTEGYRKEGKGKISITIYTEYLVTGLAPLIKEELHHEFIHAVMRYTVADYKSSPKWVREGIALYLAHQGPDRIRLFLAMPQHAAKPENLFNGLEDVGGNHTLADYPEDFLAFELLTNLTGADAPQKFNKLLMDGKNFKEALKELTQKEWNVFKEESLEYAKKKIHTYKDTCHEAYTEILNLYQKEQYAELLQKVEQALKEYPKSYLVKQILYYRARALQKLKKYEEAVECFKGALLIPPKLGLEDEAKYFMGIIYVEQKKFLEAAGLFEEVVRDYLGSAILEDACFQWGFALHEAGQGNKAREILQKCLSSFPKHKNQQNLERARKLAGTK